MLYTIVFDIREDSGIPGLLASAESFSETARVWGTSTGNCIQELNDADSEIREGWEKVATAIKERKETEEQLINTISELSNVRSKLNEAETRLTEVYQSQSHELLNAFKISSENQSLRDEVERLNREKDALIYRAEQAESNERIFSLKSESYSSGRKDALEAVRPWLEHRRNQGCLHGLQMGQECVCGLNQTLNQR